MDQIEAKGSQANNPRELVGKRIRLKAEGGALQEGWEIVVYDDEKDRFLVAPEISVSLDRHTSQWVKRENFEVI